MKHIYIKQQLTIVISVHGLVKGRTKDLEEDPNETRI
jgi:hypothetical protein